MAALDRALALAQVHGAPVSIREDLDLDVARRREVALDVDGGVPEGRPRLGARGAQRPRQILATVDQSHSLPAPAHHGLEHDGIADVLGDSRRVLVVRHGLGGSGHHGHTER